jgi:hypothetical protein
MIAFGVPHRTGEETLDPLAILGGKKRPIRKSGVIALYGSVHIHKNSIKTIS